MPHPDRALLDFPLERLWALFPIHLEAHRDEWLTWYAQEKAQLQTLLGEDTLAIHHIGSTAIPGIRAKPIVDILVETPDAAALKRAAERLDASGYLPMSHSDGRITFNKGYTLQGYAARVFHIHLRLAGDTDEVAFRDLLRSRPDLAQAYEALKIRLLAQHAPDRDAYTAGKSAFISASKG
ncbi:MAG: GrpB family protein [Comamonadaceae bacterium]|nr:GrpB family protein [Comamonadaceae bacterium]